MTQYYNMTLKNETRVTESLLSRQCYSMVIGQLLMLTVAVLSVEDVKGH